MSIHARGHREGLAGEKFRLDLKQFVARSDTPFIRDDPHLN